MPCRLGPLRAIGMHGIVGGGQVHQVEGFPGHGVSSCVQDPAVDLKGVDVRGLADAVHNPARWILRGYAHGRAVTEQSTKLVFGGDQEGAQTCRSRPLEHGLSTEKLTGLHVKFFASLPVQPIVGGYAMTLGVAGGHQGNIVDVGDAGSHPPAARPKSTPGHGVQVRSRAGIEILGIKPVDQNYYGWIIHRFTLN